MKSWRTYYYRVTTLLLENLITILENNTSSRFDYLEPEFRARPRTSRWGNWMLIYQVKKFISNPKPKHPSHISCLQSWLWNLMFLQPWIHNKHFLHHKQLQSLRIENNSHSHTYLVRDEHCCISSELSGSPVQKNR